MSDTRNQYQKPQTPSPAVAEASGKKDLKNRDMDRNKNAGISNEEDSEQFDSRSAS